MDDRGQNSEKAHNVRIEDRERMIISGVDDVESFDEDSVVIYTSQGTLTIKGDDFRINKLNVDEGELIVDGYVDSLIYTSSERKDKSGGLWSKIFR